MNILTTIKEVRAKSRAARAAGKRLGLVPTMGALHDGHLSLIREARAHSDEVAATIFVNPLQFAGNEDFARYPRTFERDCELLEAEGVGFLFAPSAAEMYPPGSLTYVEVAELGHKLCGRSRPAHFRGVSTVVAKLFHIVEPDVAFFGQKDAAQLAIIRRMVRDLDMAVEIVAAPIVREPDGLAMSSRNAYLDDRQRRAAPVLYRSLRKIEDLFRQGERDPAKLGTAGRQMFAGEPEAKLEYLEVVDPDTLEPLKSLEGLDESGGKALVALAALLGQTRLIDNLLLGASTPNGPSQKPLSMCS